MENPEKRLTIREWNEDDRPREKMVRKGAVSLSDAELLAILIASGNRNESAVELSRRIMRECNDNINELARLSINDLCKNFNGIGQAKAITIIAALELGKRRKTSDVIQRKQIKSSVDLFNLFEPVLVDLKHEEFWMVLLDSANKVMLTHKLTQGGTNQTIVDLPMLLKTALEKSAQTIAQLHTITLQDKTHRVARMKTLPDASNKVAKRSDSNVLTTSSLQEVNITVLPTKENYNYFNNRHIKKST